MSDVETIIDKLRKLRAHAESAQKIGNEAEAQAFAAKVQELLSQPSRIPSALWRFYLTQFKSDGLAGQEYVKFYHQCQEEGDVTRSRGFREAFLRGFITRLHQRFGEELRRVEKSAPTTSTAIVRLSTALKEVDKYMEKYKGRAASVHMNRSNAEGYRRGRDAADRVNLSPKVVERTGPDHKQLK